LPFSKKIPTIKMIEYCTWGIHPKLRKFILTPVHKIALFITAQNEGEARKLSSMGEEVSDLQTSKPSDTFSKKKKRKRKGY
jgi:hypothetical protein